MSKVRLGLYRHYKGGYFEVIGTAVHTETKEELVLFRRHDGTGNVWARPFSVFFGDVNGTPRFVFVGG